MLNSGAASSTALTAAAARAAHRLVDAEPLIFDDPLAHTLLGDRADGLLEFHRAHGNHPILACARTLVTTRSRFTESRLAAAVGRGTRQYVILGAGLDSFAYRADPSAAPTLAIFEVDHPDTQAWKLRRLDDASIPAPGTLSFVGVDFEQDVLADHLAAAGFDATVPAYVSWLGVSMYLTEDAIRETLAVVATFAPGTELVLDHMLPPDLCDEAGRMYAEAVGANSADQGEPWLSVLSPAEVARMCEQSGLVAVEQVSTRDSVDPALWERTDALAPIRLSALTRAVVPAIPGQFG